MILAYLDAGTGSLILQAVVGGAAGIALFFRARLARFRGRSAPEPLEEIAPEVQPEDQPTDV